MSSADCTKLSATRSTPSARPNVRSRWSFSVMSGSQRHARRVDALVLAELAAVDHARANLRRRRRLDLELDLAVVEQQAIALRHLERQLAVGRRDAARPADLVADRDHERLALLQRDRLAAFEPAGADLRAAQVLQDRDVPVGARGGGANPIERARRDRPACRARSSGA